MQVWNVLHAARARWKYRTQKLANLLGYICATKPYIDNRKKNLLNSNISSTSPHNMVNLGPLTAENSWRVWGTPANFNWVRVFVTAATLFNGSQPNFARCMAVCWAGMLYIHFRGLLHPNRILPGAKFILRPSLAFSCFGSITARHWSSGR